MFTFLVVEQFTIHDFVFTFRNFMFTFLVVKHFTFRNWEYGRMDI